MLLGLESATRRRFSAGDWDSTGRYVPGPPVEVAFKGSFQPLATARLQFLPDGQRQQGQLEVYTKTELRTADQHSETPADLVIYAGVTYQVQEVQHWPTLLAHYQARLMRVQEVEP